MEASLRASARLLTLSWPFGTFKPAQEYSFLVFPGCRIGLPLGYFFGVVLVSSIFFRNSLNSRIASNPVGGFKSMFILERR